MKTVKTPNKNAPLNASLNALVNKTNRHSCEGRNLLDETLNNLITDNLNIWTTAIKSKSRTGRGSNKTYELYGIKKLRALILDLAVRGLLVPQDLNDEPASELLKKIAVEKEQLLKEGKIKKQKPLPEISEEEKPFELPVGWEWSYMGDLSSNIHYGFTASAKPENEGTRLLRITDIQNDKVNWKTVPGCEIIEDKAKNYLLEDDDILIARTGGTIGKSYLVESINIKAVFASYLIRVKKISAMYSPYLKTYLGSSIYWRQLYDNASGTGQPNVNATALKQLFVSIPPQYEQKRIVAKVDELMVLCDQLEQQTDTSIKAHKLLVKNLLNALTQAKDHKTFQQAWQRIAKNFDTLFTTEHSIDQLKQTILQLAVMGKLVPQNPNEEPASELLKTIAIEKEKLIKQGKIKKQKLLPEINEDEKPFELPQGWEWERMQRLTSKVTDGDHKTPTRINVGMRMLSAKNVRDGFVEFNNCDFISEEDYMKSRERCMPEIGDLMIVSVGGTIGRSSLVPKDSKFSLVRSVALLKPIIFNSKYLKHTMDSPLLQNSIHENKRGGAQPCLYLSEINKFPFPLPPIKEQKRIVLIVEKLMELCDQMKSDIANSKKIQTRIANTLTQLS
jgi:type I restriction enzyme S subunit